MIDASNYSLFHSLWNFEYVHKARSIQAKILSSYSPVFMRFDFAEEMSIYGTFVHASSSLYFNYPIFPYCSII